MPRVRVRVRVGVRVGVGVRNILPEDSAVVHIAELDGKLLPWGPVRVRIRVRVSVRLG